MDAIIQITIHCLFPELVGEVSELFINSDPMTEEMIGEAISELTRALVVASTMIITIDETQESGMDISYDVYMTTLKLGVVLIITWIVWIRGRR